MAENIKYNQKADRYQDAETGRFIKNAAALPMMVDKFSTVLDSLNESSKQQVGLLSKLTNLQSNQISLIKEQNEDIRRSEKLKDIDSVNGSESIVDSTRNDQQTNGERLSFGDLVGADILGDVIAGFIGAVGGLSLASLLRGAGKVGIATVVATFMEGMISQTLEDLGTNEQIASSIGEGFKKTAIWASIGSIFGKRFAAIAAGGAILSQALENIVDQNGDGIIEAFGREWNAESISGIGGLLASAFGISLLKSTLTGTLFAASGSADPGANRALKSSLLNKFKSGFKLKFGAAAIMSLFGELLGSAIGEASGSEELGDSISSTTQFAAIGAMFGPKGALIGALAGVAYNGVNFLLDWFRDQNNKINEKLNKRMPDPEVTSDIIAEEGMRFSATQGGVEGYVDQQSQKDFDELSGRLDQTKFQDRANVEAFLNKADTVAEQIENLLDDGLQRSDVKSVSGLIKSLENAKAFINEIPTPVGGDGERNKMELLDNLNDIISDSKKELNKELSKSISDPIGGIIDYSDDDRAQRTNSYTKISQNGNQSVLNSLQQVEEMGKEFNRKTEALTQGSAQMAASPAPVVLAPDNRSNVNAPQNSTTNMTINNFSDRASGSLSRRNARAD